MPRLGNGFLLSLPSKVRSPRLILLLLCPVLKFLTVPNFGMFFWGKSRFPLNKPRAFTRLLKNVQHRRHSIFEIKIVYGLKALGIIV